MEREKAEALLDRVERHLQQKDGKTLPASQRAVLYSCLCNSNPPYKKMPDTLQNEGYGHYNWKTLKTDGYAVFKRLSNALGEEIKKKNCPRKLVDWYNHHHADIQASKPDGGKKGSYSGHAVLPDSNGQYPHDLLPFQSWESDLDRLSQAIQQRHRVIFIGGAARIGKTYFTHALIQRVQDDFDTVVRYEASNVQTLSRLYQNIRRDLSQALNDPAFGGFVVDEGDTDDTRVMPALLAILQTRRILLVIDRTDICYSSHQLAGCFRPEFTGYEQWLKGLLDSPAGEGCVVWVGRQPPQCFNAQYGMLKFHQVAGIQAADAALLLRSRQIDFIPTPHPSPNSANPNSANPNTTQRSFEWNHADWQCFVDFCGGNPAWLLVEATALGRSRLQTIRHFIADPSLDRSVVEILSQVLSTLAPIEYRLLCWLLLKPLSYQDIRQLEGPDLSSNLSSNVSSSAWESAVISLEQRSLVRQDSDQRYRLNPPILAHILAQQLVQAIVTELSASPDPQAIDTSTTRLQLHHSIPLFHGATSAEQQGWLQKNLWMAIANAFKRGVFQPQQRIERLQSLFSMVQDDPALRQGYATSNLLNLAITLDLPLSKFEVAGLSIRHVDLRQANLHQADFARCEFQHILLPLSLTGRLAAAMTPEGNAIAIGDATGALFYWQRQGNVFRLKAIAQLPPLDSSAPDSSAPEPSETLEEAPIAIEHMIFQGQNTVIVVSQQRVYSWWVDDPMPPSVLTALPAPFSCMAQSSVGHVAVGLTNGAIILWDDMCVGQGTEEGDRPQTLMAHRNTINHLAFSPDGYSLISICEGHQGLIWDLRHWPRLAPTYREWPLGILCWDVRWTRDGRLRAEADPMSTHIRVRKESFTTTATFTGAGAFTTDSAMPRGCADIVSWAFPAGQLTSLSFSQNAAYLSGSSRTQAGDSIFFCWNWQTDTYRSIQRSNCYGDVLATCEAGRLMLVCQGNQIQVFDLEQRELIWQMDSQQPTQGNRRDNRGNNRNNPFKSRTLSEPTLPRPSEPCSINLQQVQGLSEVEVEQLQIKAESMG